MLLLDILIFEKMGLIKTGINWGDPKLNDAMKYHAKAAKDLADAIEKHQLKILVNKS